MFQDAQGGLNEELAGTFSVGFQTGAGKVDAPPSSAAQARARSMFDEDALPATAQSSIDPAPAFRPSQPSNAIASGSRPAPTTKSRIGAIFLDEQISRPSLNSPNSFTTPRPAQQRQSATGSTFRTPLRTTTNTPTVEPTVMTGSPAPRKFKPIEIGTPMLRRRVGLGMTPSSRFGKKTAVFTTPFKSSQEAVPLPRTSVAAPTVVAAPVIEPVFDVDRESRRDQADNSATGPENLSRGLPQASVYYHSGAHRVWNVSAITGPADISPEEIYVMELRFAKGFRFVNDDDSDLGPAEALAKLKADGCEYATPAWTLNHWSMIIWKLAGIIQAQHNLYDKLWNWEEVVSQLLYRYVK
jgi:hypothetical protein